jgi:fructosamine-3-kinase
MDHAEDATPLPDRRVLDEIGASLGEDVTSAEYVTSGAANHVFRITTDAGTRILKASRTDLPDMFALETQGLEHMASTGAVPVPAVLLATSSCLVLEDLGDPTHAPTDDDWARLGAGLGGMHSVTDDRFGYPNDNYLGIWHQRNARSDDWVEFFATNRVLCYLDAGHNATILTAEDRRGLERLIARLGELVPEQKPSLCHGDLWRNNAHLAADGRFCLIDPAVYFGLPEQDLAQTQMYERFPEPFYEGYRSTHELDADWHTRLPLYQLKELLLMVAQFEHEESLATLRELIARYR